MAEENYTVKINRRDGVLEIAGPDKDWIAEQLDRLAVVYDWTQDSPADPPPASDAAAGSEDAGVIDVQEVTPAKPAPKRRAKSGGSRPTRVPELAEKLTPEVRNSINKYVEERRSNFSDAMREATILATFLKVELGQVTLQPNDLYTIYDVMGWKSSHPRNALENAKNKKKWFSLTSRGVYELSHAGEQWGRHEAKDAPAAA
jgi:hypothetical protein